jgi:hypothetical protein
MGHRGAGHGRRIQPGRRIHPYARALALHRDRRGRRLRPHPHHERVIYALAFISPTPEKVVSTGVPTELIRGDVFFWQSLQAANILVAVPTALVFNLFLARFISGFTMGAVKG